LKALKGNTARFLFKEFPALKEKLWGGHLWNPSYFAASVGENTEEAVKKCVESQKEGGEIG
jgi:putative transposase